MNVSKEVRQSYRNAVKSSGVEKHLAGTKIKHEIKLIYRPKLSYANLGHEITCDYLWDLLGADMKLHSGVPVMQYLAEVAPDARQVVRPSIESIDQIPAIEAYFVHLINFVILPAVMKMNDPRSAFEFARQNRYVLGRGPEKGSEVLKIWELHFNPNN